MIPDNITKEHLKKAIEEIDSVGIRKGRHSSTYDLVHNNKSYPPKLVISLANKYAKGHIKYITRHTLGPLAPIKNNK